jgi:hypothetical protein
MFPFPGFLTDRSRGRTVHVIHVGHSPMIITYSDGHEVRALIGLDACKAHLLTGVHACADLNDGELVAWSLADQIVGQPILDALFDGGSRRNVPHVAGHKAVKLGTHSKRASLSPSQ